MKNVAKIKT